MGSSLPPSLPPSFPRSLFSLPGVTKHIVAANTISKLLDKGCTFDARITQGTETDRSAIEVACSLCGFPSPLAWGAAPTAVRGCGGVCVGRGRGAGLVYGGRVGVGVRYMVRKPPATGSVSCCSDLYHTRCGLGARHLASLDLQSGCVGSISCTSDATASRSSGTPRQYYRPPCYLVLNWGPFQLIGGAPLHHSPFT